MEYTPAAASAIVTLTQAVVSWVPGPELADFYNVYGITASGAAVTLAQSAGPVPDAASLVVDGSYATYAVTGVRDGVESPPVYAVMGEAPVPPCVDVDPSSVPPAYYIGPSCLEFLTNHTPKGVIRS